MERKHSINSDDEILIPMPQIISIASYMSLYESSKLNLVSTYFFSCMQNYYKVLYNELKKSTILLDYTNQ
jgi:hypothetical protein